VIELSRLVSDTQQAKPRHQKNRLLVQRVPGDKLRVTIPNGRCSSDPATLWH